MLSRIIVFYCFYRRILRTAGLLSLCVGLLGLISGGFHLVAAGYFFLLAAPLTHFFGYHQVHKSELHFYGNLGFTVRRLWIFSMLTSVTIGYGAILIGRNL